MVIDPKGLEAACEAWFEVIRSGELGRDNRSQAIEAAISAYLKATETTQFAEDYRRLGTERTLREASKEIAKEVRGHVPDECDD
jgi:hypothetical protein